MTGTGQPYERVARSYLFVPGTRPERFAKAIASGAHAVIVDLEDAVAPADKERAREIVASALDAAHPLYVRINGIGTPWFDADLALCAHPGIAGVVLPKAEDADAVAAVHAATHGRAIVLPLIESAAGLWNARAIAEAPGVLRLAFGSIDFQVDLGISDDDLLAYRAAIVLASRVAGRIAPVDGVTTSIDDAALVRRDAERARALGFGGKLCIHPAQVAIVNAAFRPTEAEVAWAERVVAADAAAQGAAVAVDGRMVDRPVLLQARAILSEVERIPRG
ncbi:MAG TPA: CoA ester lyase [Burkholderiaceae bacterium]|nr:CoA ester lyase [Burkholderiaceae bacterium]HQR76941.1 CoA ester lyase [Burkholderiaceae bacterium]